MSMDDKYWEAINRIMTHEAMCEERSKTIFTRLENIESQLKGMNKNLFILGLTLMSGMAGVIFTLLTQ